MSKTIRIGDRTLGEGHPVYIVAEIGLNHNGDIEIARQLIDAAKVAGCDAVKFQKRTPEKCTPPEQAGLLRETPWGLMTYLDYRHRIELGHSEYEGIDRYCRERQMTWFASVWDEDSLDFLRPFNLPCYKVPSAAVTDHSLLRHARAAGQPLIVSTGMSTMDEIRAAVDTVGTGDLLLTHCTSTYPSKPDELNLRVIQALRQEFDCPIGYSGHEVGLQATYAAVALGACYVERHITLDRAMWGSDQAASVEPGGLIRLVRDIRVIERGMGDGQKRVYDSEKPIMKKLRRVGNDS